MLREVLDVLAVLDDPHASGAGVAALLRMRGATRVAVETVRGTEGGTDFVRLVVPGTTGKDAGGAAPTLGIIGRLGGVGARPGEIGYVSDGDGATAALAAGLKLVDMARRGDRLAGDVIVATHVCPDAPQIPHDPVPFMGSPVDMATMNRLEVDPAMDAVLAIDTTKGNRIVNHRGIAISPTVRQGWILRVSESLLDVLQRVTGQMPIVFPITMQDITPYGNGVYHLNSILQPATATGAPVVGVAITAEVAVPGSGTGASHEADIELAARFAVEVAKGFGSGRVRFHDPEEFARLVRLYGEMRRLQTPGVGSGAGSPARA
jgi:hypothetical protein